MQAIYKCSNLIEGKSDEQAEAAIKDMERLIELTQVAIKEGKISNVVKTSQPCPRVEKWSDVARREPTPPDPLRSVTRAMSKLNSLLKTATTPSTPTTVVTEGATVPRVQAKQQVPRVKQQVPRVAKSQPTQPKQQGILKPPTKSENGPASRTRSQTKSEPVASRTRGARKYKR